MLLQIPFAHSHSTRNWDHAALLPLKILKLASLNQSLQKIRKKIPSSYVVQCCKQVARVWFLNQSFAPTLWLLMQENLLCAGTLLLPSLLLKEALNTFTSDYPSALLLYLVSICALYSVAVFLLKTKTYSTSKKVVLHPIKFFKVQPFFLI